MRIVTSLMRKFGAQALLGTVALLSTAGGRAQVFETVLSTNLFQPASISVDDQNQYVIADTSNHRVVKFNSDSRVFTVLAGPDRVPFESGAVDGSGTDAKFRNPQSVLAVGNRVFVADTGNHVIRVIEANGNVNTIAGDIQLAHEADDFGVLPSNWGYVDGPAATARFSGPCGLAMDGAGHLYIADSGNHAIRMLDLNSGIVSTVVSSGISTPVGLALSSAGTLFISDSSTHSVKRWAQGETKATLVAGSGTALGRGFRNSSIATNALFSAPSGIYYREATDELIVADLGNSVLRTISGISGAAPKVDTFANTSSAGFQTPVAVTRDIYGVFLVCDSSRSTIEGVITVRYPRIDKPQVGFIQTFVDADTGVMGARLAPVTDSVFDNMIRVAVSGDSTAQHYFNFSAGLSGQDSVANPSTNSTTAQDFFQPVIPAPPDAILNNLSINSSVQPRYIFRVKVFSAPKGADERIPSLVTEATFRFKCATPQMDSQSTPGRLIFRCNTINAIIYYTLDGTEPVKGAEGSTAKPLRSGESIPLVLGTSSVVVKARAYLDDRFLASDVAKVEFSPGNFIPNRISLGFEDGEASSLMRASPGQRFFAPITLSLMPGAKAYGLQFDVGLEPKSGPVSSNFQLDFHSTLMERFLDRYRIIPPAVHVSGGLTDLVLTNQTPNSLAVGWIERASETNLYNTLAQHLLSYSQAHNNTFLSENRETIVGGFSFIVPTNASNGNAYTLRVSRPSATADGVSQDMYIQAPGEEDTASPVKAVRTLNITNRIGYIVGDVSDFRWFNAGEFGDGNILNNDLTDLHQGIVYGLNLPPMDSDFMDAMDTCCYTEDGRDLSSIDYVNGPALNINEIAFGDGSRSAPLGHRPFSRLEVNDLFVAFRRSLDTSLVWYERYWSNGTRQASIVSNTFRAESAPLSRQSTLSATSIPVGPAVQSAQSPLLTVFTDTTTGTPGSTVVVPIRVRVDGGYPLRTLMFTARVETADGTVVPTSTLDVAITDALGLPTVELNNQPGRSGAAWLETSVAGVLGEQVVGRLLFTIPADAPATSLYYVKLDRVSGSPNGITLFPIRIGTGLIAMANRPAPVWNDGIPDAWRQQYFGSLSDIRSAAEVDADGDGLSNYQEYKLGTNPLDATDNLTLKVAPFGNGAKLRFKTLSGQKYRIEGSVTLEPGTWSTMLSDVAGNGAEMELPAPGDAKQFYYRVRLQD